ncbi:MAG: sensor histidine kinase [Candidatus Omnitrophica bacterium]|nr:sensor histidine kinase [Candidatus Omnitrophota bacterium]
MKNFFIFQYDYVYFFYGFAFLLLSFLCFSLSRDREQILPWVWLGLFGFIHGLNEWMEIFKIDNGINVIFSVIHLTILFASYVCFLEFAIISFKFQKKIFPRLLIYSVLLPLVISGIKGGLTGVNITTRYFIGFPAGILSSWVIFSASKLNPTKGKPLKILSVCLFLYAILSGLIVSKANFLLAPWLNSDVFFDKTGIPIQFARAILALVSAMALWFYPYNPTKIDFLSKKPLIYWKPSKWIILITLVFFISAGWIFTNYLDYYAGMQLIQKSRENKYSSFNILIKELAQLELIANTISKSIPVKTALLTRQDHYKADALVMVNDYMKKFTGAECFLLDLEGKLIFKSGDTSFENKDYPSFTYTPYFKKAIEGKTGYYFTLGAIYTQRVYYVSFPIKADDTKIIGVVVLKKNISASPIIRYRLLSIFFTMVVCILTVLFFIALKRRETIIALVNEMNEKLNSVDKMKNDFVAIVSHELRTPLTSIKNAATILLKDKTFQRLEDEERKEFLEMILNNTDRLAYIVSDLLDISKIEAGVLKIYKVPSNIFLLAKDVINNLQNFANEKHIKLNIQTDKELIILQIDPEKTRRIFMNLIHNAIKFTPEGGKITIKFAETVNEVQICVSDTGIGMSKEDTEKIFNKFFQSSDSRVQQESGSGLGLAITQGLIELQGGKIWVKSVLNEGSSFYFTFPV